MNLQRTAICSAVLAATIGLAGCSGSTGNGSSSADVTGRITAFGSVYVDGVEYETNDNITIDGQPATEADLNVGMIVTIHGSDNGANGNATSISFTDELEGVVMSNDINGLVVMGFNITTDNQTNLDGFTDIATLAVGDVVEISGYPDGNGGIHATYIESKGAYVAGSEIEVKGIVAGLTASTFTIGSMTVDFSAATHPTLADGMYVEVKGTSVPVAGTFTATEVELEDDGIDGDEGDEIEVEGILSAIDSTSVTVGNTTYTLATDAEIDDDIAVGDMVEIEMEVTNGVMLVEEVEKEDADDDHPGKIEIEGTPSATDTVLNTITIADITISVNPNTTVMMDKTTANEHYFNLGSIELTDRIEVEAAPDGSGGYNALTIERVPADSTTFELEGPVVKDATTGALSIAGIALDTGAMDVSTINNGDKTHANGTYNSGTLTVTEIEWE